MRGRVVAIAVFVPFLLAGCANLPKWVPFADKLAGSNGQASSPLRDLKGERMRAARAKQDEAPKPPIDDSVADRVVAVVNNDAITWGELLEAIAVYRQENRQKPGPSDDELARQFLNRLIDQRLQLQEAKDVAVEDIELTEEIGEVMKKVGAKTEEDLDAMLRAQGVSMEALKKRTRERIRVSKVVRRKVSLRVSVMEDEIDRYLEQNRAKLETGLTYHARHILIAPDGSSEAAWAAAKQRAETICDQLEKGADFAQLARSQSADATAKDGGDLGTLKRGELAQDVEAHILALSPAATARPYRSPLGWHIFRLEEKETLVGDSLQRTRQQIRDILLREKYEARFETWLKELKQRAIIEVRM
jgi:peptidyl-prolyl cis-trans isomerase SurA